jgi:hypothetical protein
MVIDHRQSRLPVAVMERAGRMNMRGVTVQIPPSAQARLDALTVQRDLPIRSGPTPTGPRHALLI